MSKLYFSWNTLSCTVFKIFCILFYLCDSILSLALSLCLSSIPLLSCQLVLCTFTLLSFLSSPTFLFFSLCLVPQSQGGYTIEVRRLQKLIMLRYFCLPSWILRESVSRKWMGEKINFNFSKLLSTGGREHSFHQTISDWWKGTSDTGRWYKTLLAT